MGNNFSEGIFITVSPVTFVININRMKRSDNGKYSGTLEKDEI